MNMGNAAQEAFQLAGMVNTRHGRIGPDLLVFIYSWPHAGRPGRQHPAIGILP